MSMDSAVIHIQMGFIIAAELSVCLDSSLDV